MKLILIVSSVSLLAAVQTIFLPVNLALILMLFLSNSANTQFLVVPIVASSLVLSLFSNLSLGVTLFGFSASIFIYLLLRRFLPSRLIIKIFLFVVTLIFWEVSVITFGAIFSKLL